MLGHIAAGSAAAQIIDAATEAAYRETRAGDVVTLGGARTIAGVPLRKDRTLLGAITIYRQEVRAFTEKQIALLENFAAQAVIAMENARLLTETREALEQQTATAEVLQVINSSPGDLAPVFAAILQKAHALCGADHGHLTACEGGQFRALATHGVPEAFEKLLRQPFRPGLDVSRCLRAGESVIQFTDMAALSYDPDDRIGRGAAELAGARTLLIVALRKDDALLGYITAHRTEVRPFSEKEIALLQNFAAQAVIAMENARLLTETREALEQQTATAEVLQVINSSPGDLAPVFNAILEKAHALCEASFGALMTYDGEQFQPVALQGVATRFWEFIGQGIRPKSGDPFGRMVEGAPLSHIHDLSEVASQYPNDALPRAAVDLGGIRTFLIVPLRKDSALLGAITAYRQEVRPFTDKQISLLQNFAAQAVIAMENARLLRELQQRTDDLQESLEYQTAISEVLRVISGSAFDLEPVLQSVVSTAIRLCRADQAVIYRNVEGEYRWAAGNSLAPEYEKIERDVRIHPGIGTVVGRAALEAQPVHILDCQTDPSYEARDDAGVGGIHTLLGVPLLREGLAIGVIGLARQRVEAFTEKEIALVTTFADQAVIAIENARLLNDLQQRTSDLQEFLEYQTATSDVLKVISQSTFDLEPVLQTVLDTAIRLCGNRQGLIFRRDADGRYRLAATSGTTPDHREIEANLAIEPGPDTLVGRVVLARQPVEILDPLADPDYALKHSARAGNLRTMLGVPLLREDVPIGVFCTAREIVEPFTAKQIELVQTFADQAVIAIENARLFNELRQRTGDLQESLEYQTAISDVLKVISRSVFDLNAVLQTVVVTAIRLCRADHAVLYRREGDEYRWAVGHGVPTEYEKIERNLGIRPGTGTLVGRAALETRTIQILDAWNDPHYEAQGDARVGGVRTLLGVPLLRESEPIGVIGLGRNRVEAFSEREIQLVTTFADQAVIAIENARLISELRDRTAELGRSVEELKMLSEVGQAVSSTLDLRTVLSKILTASLGVTWANAGAIFRYIRAERTFRLVEAVGWDEALQNSVGDLRVAEAETAMGEAAARRTPVQIVDLAARPSAPLRDASLAAGFHSALIVPLVGAERTLGAIVLMRREAGEFPPETVRLLQTLASQSVLAIQNARLFREIADKSEQLALASQHKSQFLANMSHELRTPLNAILGYAELLVDGIYGVLPEKAQGVLERVQNNGQHLLALINDVLDLAKIEAGQLTLTIEDYALSEVVRSVVTATEPLAAAKGLKFTTDVQDNMPMAHGDARRVSQVLLNLVGNAIKFTDQGEVGITASLADGQFALEVRDTGPGIADADQERIFGEFQQIDNSSTRKKGGTGLGLAISKRMVEIQGGMISVESALGRGSTFRVVLPVHVEPALEEAA